MLCIIIKFLVAIFVPNKIKRMKKIISTILFGLVISINVIAQNNVIGKKYIYEFRDGTVIIGTFIKDESGNIYINDLNGEEIYLPKVMVAQIHTVTDENLKGAEYWFPNLHDSRYFFAPSAFGLEEGEGYYSHSFWVFWQAQFGITDNLSIGGGTTPFGFPSTVNTKYSFSVDKYLQAALGWFYVGDLFNISGGRFEGSLINMPYTVLSYGNKENNFTFGMGYTLSDDVDTGERPVISLGATYRTGRRFALVFEGWIFGAFSAEDPNLLGGPGIRYFRKVNRVTAKNGAGASTWDFQLLMNPELEGVIPMFGASRKF